MNIRIRQRAVKILICHNWCTWNTLVAGWDLGFIAAQDVINYATNFLCRHPDEERDAVIDLAGASPSQERFIRETLKSIVSDEGKSSFQTPINKDVWLLSSLLALQEADISERETLEQLAEIYADFGYPKEMEDCVYYMPSNRAPAEAWRELIASLTTKIEENKG